MDPEEPARIEDIKEPFSRIAGDWAFRARAELERFGVPCPATVDPKVITEVERRLSVRLNIELRTFLMELGPVDTDEIRFLDPQDFTTLEHFYARDLLTESDAAELPILLAVAEYAGTDDPFALHLDNGTVVRVGHDPPGFSMHFGNFTDLLRYAFIGISGGYYGFPGDHVQRLVSEARFHATGIA